MKEALKKLLPVFLPLFLCGFLLSCATPDGVQIEDQPYALTELRKAFAEIFETKMRATSENGRDLDSPYFGKVFDDPNFDPQKAKERYTAHFQILGDRRPYTLGILVTLERKTRNGYEVIGEDPKQSEIIAKKLMERLHQGTDKRNAIDDFRPF